MPLFRAKKEIFEWIKQGRKTIDIRKGKPHRGEIAFFQSGPHSIKMKIIRKETGQLTDVVRQDNFRSVIPVAIDLGEAVAYLCGIYGDGGGVFTAYYLDVYSFDSPLLL